MKSNDKCKVQNAKLKKLFLFIHHFALCTLHFLLHPSSLIPHPFFARLVAFLLIAVLLCSLFTSPRTQAKVEAGSQLKRAARRVLVISLDGLDARYLNRRDELGLKIPTLRRLMREGVAARGVTSVYPSVTYPAHTTMMTGAWPSRHGIYGNELLGPQMSTVPLEWHWFARDIRAETLWDAARVRGLKVGMVSWPVGGGAGDYNVPEILRFGGTLEDSLTRIRENALPANLVAEVERRDPLLYKQASRDEQDDMRARFASYIIEEKRPEVMLVHLFDLDHFQHVYGPFTKEAINILEKTDGYVGRLVEALRRAGTLHETDIFITSDHGFKPISKLVHPGVALERAGFLKVQESVDAQGKTQTIITDWRAVPYFTNGSCAIILRDEKDGEALDQLREIFKTWMDVRRLAGLQPSILRIIEGKELAALHVNPRVALMLEAADGYAFGKNYTGDLTTESKDRGAHGYLPTRPDYYASFIASGPRVSRRGSLSVISMIDIGPTIARSLGLRLRAATGRAIPLQRRKG